MFKLVAIVASIASCLICCFACFYDNKEDDQEYDYLPDVEDAKYAFNRECPFCLEEFREKEEIYITSCMHGFHKTCSTEWFSKDKEVECPYCRHPI